jgi:hypothetical protein
MNIVGLLEWKWSAVSVVVLVGGSIVGCVGGSGWSGVKEGAGCWSAVSPMSHLCPLVRKECVDWPLGLGKSPPEGVA